MPEGEAPPPTASSATSQPGPGVTSCWRPHSLGWHAPAPRSPSDTNAPGAGGAHQVHRHTRPRRPQTRAHSPPQHPTHSQAPRLGEHRHPAAPGESQQPGPPRRPEALLPRQAHPTCAEALRVLRCWPLRAEGAVPRAPLQAGDGGTGGEAAGLTRRQPVTGSPGLGPGPQAGGTDPRR